MLLNLGVAEQFESLESDSNIPDAHMCMCTHMGSHTHTHNPEYILKTVRHFPGGHSQRAREKLGIFKIK